MATLFAILELKDYAIIAIIVAVFAGGATALTTNRPEINLTYLELLEFKMNLLQKKLDALLKHQGIDLPTPPPSGLSPEVEYLASVPGRKIAAIRLYRQQNPGVGLAEAKAKIEKYCHDSRSPLPHS